MEGSEGCVEVWPRLQHVLGRVLQHRCWRTPTKHASNASGTADSGMYAVTLTDFSRKWRGKEGVGGTEGKSRRQTVLPVRIVFDCLS